MREFYLNDINYSESGVENLLEWLEQVRQEQGYDFLGIGINVAPKTQATEIRWCFVAGNQNDAYRNICLEVGRGLAGNVWKTGRLQIEENLQQNPSKVMAYPIVRLENLQAAATIPLLKKGVVEGVLLAGLREQASIEPAKIPELEKLAKNTQKRLEELGVLD